MIRIECRSEPLQAALRAAATQLGSLERPLSQAGEVLARSTVRRFHTSTGPDGTPWKPNAPNTILAWLREQGRIARGSPVARRRPPPRVLTAADKKPLVWHGTLRRTISYVVVRNTLRIGSPMVYAPTHQFGRGRIPPRPFLGLSQADVRALLEIITDYVQQATAARRG